MKILVLNGPNLNLLGLSGDRSYGEKPLREINEELQELAAAVGSEIEFLQSNHEGVLIDRVHSAILEMNCDAIILNPGPLRHTSLGLADALRAFSGPVYEIHIQRKGEAEFRHPTIMKSDHQYCGPAETIYLETLKALLRREGGKGSAKPEKEATPVNAEK
jgi:3-dehydroquinate dehydratase-2